MRSTAFVDGEEDQSYQASLGILALLTAASLSTPLSDQEEETNFRRTYLSWLYDRVLRKRFAADPKLISSTAELLKEIFGDLKRAAEQDELRIMAIDLLLQSFYSDLPKPIRMNSGETMNLCQALTILMQFH